MGTSNSTLTKEEWYPIIKEAVSDSLLRNHFNFLEETDTQNLSELKMDYFIDLKNAKIGPIKSEINHRYNDLFEKLCPNGEKDMNKIAIGNISVIYVPAKGKVLNGKFTVLLKYKDLIKRDGN